MTTKFRHISARKSIIIPRLKNIPARGVQYDSPGSLGGHVTGQTDDTYATSRNLSSRVIISIDKILIHDQEAVYQVAKKHVRNTVLYVILLPTNVSS